jgi:hypothetical protein
MGSGAGWGERLSYIMPKSPEEKACLRPMNIHCYVKVQATFSFIHNNEMLTALLSNFIDYKRIVSEAQILLC